MRKYVATTSVLLAWAGAGLGQAAASPREGATERGNAEHQALVVRRRHSGGTTR